MDWRSHWTLDPQIRFLNHGAHGACPIAVLDYQQELRAQLEREPVYFFNHRLEPLLDEARQALAEFVGADPEDLVFVSNATTGVNAVLRSLSFQPGDELLTTNHEYNASRNVLNFVAERSGATVVVAEIPFPLQSAAQITETILAKVSPRTRLLLVDQVSSPTAIVFPLQAIAQAVIPQGIEVLVDGAHAPGMLPLNLRELGVTYYTGNCHKWMCAPKGAAFLYVQRDRQSAIRPTVISHGANSPRSDRSRFQLEFGWMGTDDPTPALSVPKTLQTMAAMLPGGWAELQATNRAQAIAAQRLLCEALGIAPPVPEALLGSMAALPLPITEPAALQNKLFQAFQIEVPVFPWADDPPALIRISAQLYNTEDEYRALAIALQSLSSIQDGG